MEKTNPFFKKRPSQSSEEGSPIFSRLPHHFFTDFDGMKKELYPWEACIAHIKNTDPKFPFTHHTAVACKDGEGRLYTAVMTQHDGQLKADPTEAIEKIVKAVQPQQHPKKNKKKSKKKRRK